MSLRRDAVHAAVRCRVGAWRGLRDERIDPALLAAVVAAVEDESALEVLKCDERSRVSALERAGVPVVVKEVRKGGARRRAADALRGGPATRAFRAGRELIVRGIGAALPLAALEQRSLGIPRRSLLVSLDLRCDDTAAHRLESEPVTRAQTLAALVELMIALHRGGAVHGDLRAQHVHLARPSPGERATMAQLVDLEGVRFRRRLSDERRIEDLAQLNASIADELASPEERRAALETYAAALPFSRGVRWAESEVVRRSIARQHRFRGCDCASATSGS